MEDDVRAIPALRDSPTPARIYDYWLGGKDNFEVDRAVGAEMIAALGPETDPRAVAWENRRFQGRVVEYLAREHGISQFIDVGAGLPTMRSTHEIAQETIPGARVAYVDNDPIVLSHGRALLGKGPDIAIVTADMRDPAAILDHPDTKALIDFGEPVAVLFISVLHFIPGPGHPRYREGDAAPDEIVAAFRDRVAPGSRVAISHLTPDNSPPEIAARAEQIYSHASAPMVPRTRDEVLALFDGWRLEPPGLVKAWEWRPGPNESPRSKTLWAGVGVKDPA